MSHGNQTIAKAISRFGTHSYSNEQFWDPVVTTGNRARIRPSYVSDKVREMIAESGSLFKSLSLEEIQKSQAELELWCGLALYQQYLDKRQINQTHFFSGLPLEACRQLAPGQRRSIFNKVISKMRTVNLFRRIQWVGTVHYGPESLLNEVLTNLEREEMF